VYINKKNFRPEIKYNRLKHVRTWVEPKGRYSFFFFLTNQKKINAINVYYIFSYRLNQSIMRRCKEKIKRKEKKAVVVFTNDDNPTLPLRCSDTDH